MKTLMKDWRQSWIWSLVDLLVGCGTATDHKDLKLCISQHVMNTQVCHLSAALPVVLCPKPGWEWMLHEIKLLFCCMSAVQSFGAFYHPSSAKKVSWPGESIRNPELAHLATKKQPLGLVPGCWPKSEEVVIQVEATTAFYDSAKTTIIITSRNKTNWDATRSWWSSMKPQLWPKPPGALSSVSCEVWWDCSAARKRMGCACGDVVSLLFWSQGG